MESTDNSTHAQALWNHEERNQATKSGILGYEVETDSGDGIGKVSDESTEADAEHIVVDTGQWIFGKKRLIPAAAVRDIDHDNEKVSIVLSREQVENAPDWDDDSFFTDHKSSLDDYYNSTLPWPAAPMN